MDRNTRLLHILDCATRYCSLLENCEQMEREEFLTDVTLLLPEIYLGFAGTESLSAEDPAAHMADYLEEDYYESIRRRLEALMAEDDIFLETQVADMKYSDTPIGMSVSELLADIFQPLYNFVWEVRDTDGDNLEQAFAAAQETFVEYWSQTLCNVMRPLNSLRFKP